MSAPTLRRLLGATAAITFSTLTLAGCSESATGPAEAPARVAADEAPDLQAVNSGGGSGQRVASAASLLARTHQVYALVTVPTDANPAVGVAGHVFCPSGEVATGGGFSINEAVPAFNAAFKVLESRRWVESPGGDGARSGWRARFFPGDWQYVAIIYATCVPTQ